MSFYHKILEFLFPDRCAGCRARGELVCKECLARIRTAEPPIQAWISASLSYQNKAVKRLVWMLKYRHARRIAKIFGPYLYETLFEECAEKRSFRSKARFVLVPIPLSKKRRRKRGYNQAEILAKEILKNDEEGFFEMALLLEKMIDTKPQAEIHNRSARLKNLGDCFRVRAECARTLSPRDHLILVDDVTTTGATLSAARDTLRAAGFRHISAITVAH